MKIKSIRFLIVLMSLTYSATLAQNIKRLEEVPMQMINGLPYLEAMINGKGPYLFGFDSGMGGDMELDSTLAVELNLKVTDKTQAGDPSGKNSVTLDVTQVNEVQIGKIKLNNAVAVLRNRRALRGMEKVSGIIGITLLSNYVFTLDYPNNKFYIDAGRLIANNADVIPYETYGGGVPAIKILVGDHSVTALIDTRSMSSEVKIPESLISKLHFASEPREVGKGRTISNVISINEVKLQETIKIGKYDFLQPTVTYPSLSEEALIGARLLKNFAFSIDAKSKTVKFIKGSSPVNPEVNPSTKANNSNSALKEYTGHYGERTVFLEDDGLYLQRASGSRLKMVIKTKDEYSLEVVPQAHIVFVRNENGKIVSLKSLQPNGEWQTSNKEL